MATIRIGISGWRYAPWRGDSIPKACASKATSCLSAAGKAPYHRDQRHFYSRCRRPKLTASGAARRPRISCSRVKGPRYITHMRRLQDRPARLGHTSFGRGRPGAGATSSGPSCGSGRQLPRFDCRNAGNELFSPAAAQPANRPPLARRHDGKLRRPRLAERLSQPYHPSCAWKSAMTVSRRRGIHPPAARHDIGAGRGRYPYNGRLLDGCDSRALSTVRLHGDEKLYVSGYGEKALNSWAARIRAWTGAREAKGGEHAGPPARRKRRDVYVYFDNDAKVRAPFDAQMLMRLLPFLSCPKTHGSSSRSCECFSACRSSGTNRR